MRAMTERPDPERDRLFGRARRFAQVGAGVGRAGMAFGANRLFAGGDADARNARAIKEALGGLKGPLMKAAQMFATVPDLLPPELAAELGELQANAPSMGRGFVRRRMAAELGPDWEARFGSFELDAAAAASLGQVHRATTRDGRALAVKLQYPEMQSAVESDLGQLRTLMGLMSRMERSIDASQALVEIGERLREELDYEREAKAMRLYRNFFADRDDICVPEPVDALCTHRLLSMTWLDGQGLLAFKGEPLETRNRIARLLFDAWWRPMTTIGVIHGDPHLGNYALTPGADRLNLLDFGCIRVFPPQLRRRAWCKLLPLDRPRATAPASARPTKPGAFKGLSDDLMDVLGIWARFIYGPLLDDRVRTVADGVAPGDYGRREAFHRASRAAQGREGTGHHPARVRVHGPRRHRPRQPPFCTWARR